MAWGVSKAVREGFARIPRNEIGLKPLKTKETAKWLIQRPQLFQRLKGSDAKRFVSHRETRLSRPSSTWEGSVPATRQARCAPLILGLEPNSRTISRCEQRADRSSPSAAMGGNWTMKRILLALAAATVLSSPAFAATKIGVSMDKFDDNFLTVLRNGMADYAKTVPGVTLQIEDAKDDVSKQLSQVQNFIANGVNAIIVNPVDTSATGAITKAAADAGVPLVYVNREPIDVDKLGPKAAFVASNEAESGTLEAKQLCQV